MPTVVLSSYRNKQVKIILLLFRPVLKLYILLEFRFVFVENKQCLFSNETH